MMELTIRKRNGKEVLFDGAKIEEAVKKAMLEVGEDKQDLSIPSLVADIVSNKCYSGIDVEKIQDLVVATLLGLGYHEIANHYISYRAVRSYEREKILSKLYSRMGDIVEFGDNENSNKNYKLPSVKRDTVAGEYFRAKLFEVLPSHIAEAHASKAIHWHDSDTDTKVTNCCVVNIYDMLKNGTRVTNADIDSPKSVGTAMNIAMQIMASVSATQYGKILP